MRIDQKVEKAFQEAERYGRPNEGVRTIARLEETAKAKGCTVQYPAAHVLFLDFDGWLHVLAFLLRYALIRRKIGAQGFSLWRSPSRRLGRYHGRVWLARPIPAPEWQERLVLQASLGSDVLREQIAVRQMVAGSPLAVHSVLFERVARP